MRRLAAWIVAALAIAGCSSTSTSTSTGAPQSSVPLATTTAASDTVVTSATTSTTLAPTTMPAPTTSTIPDFLGEESIGTSVEGRPLTAYHRGTAGGIVVIVVGVIHGDEDAGLQIIDQLRTLPVPAGYDLWLLPMLNPDGQAHQTRKNAHGVDLNRNFPHDWAPVTPPSNWEYSGPSAGSEPETKAFVAFAQRVKPRLVLWYHQNANLITPSSRADGPLRKRYAQLTGLPYTTLTGGTYVGVAATWVRTEVRHAMSFIIELGDSLTPTQALTHANAVLTIMAMIKPL